MKQRNKSINLNVRGMSTSATLAINERSAEIIKSGKKVYRLGLGQSPFPIPESVVDTLKAHAHEKDYLPVRGLPELCEAVARFHRVRDNVSIDPEYVMIGPGSKELMFLLQLMFYGEIIIPTPCWVSYLPQANILGRKVRFIHTGFQEKWRLLPEQLTQLAQSDDDHYRPRLLILNYPGNPSGTSYTADELKQIANIARRYDMIILSDEIYGLIDHKGEHMSIAQYYPEGTIISSGLSKWCGAGGWRLGTFAFPKELSWILKTMTAIASETYTSVCAPVQYAAVTAFHGSAVIEDYLQHSQRILETIGNAIYTQLSSAGVNVHPPEGAFYIFPDFLPFEEKLARQGIHNSTVLCERILEETNVAILPGSSFGRPPEELTARLAYVNFDGAKALEISHAIPMTRELTVDDLAHTCDDVLRAVQNIIDWLKLN